MTTHGGRRAGSGRKKSEVTGKQLLEYRKLYGMNCNELAIRFGIGRGTVSRIIKRYRLEEGKETR